MPKSKPKLPVSPEKLPSPPGQGIKPGETKTINAPGMTEGGSNTSTTKT